MKITVKDGTLPQKEIDAIVAQLRNNNPDKYINSVEITVSGEYLDIHCEYEAVPFERIRRITGYLVGGLERFNDAKKAEEKDRVKHDI